MAHVEGKDWRVEMQRFLTAYRSTPHTSTGASPYYLMFGREMKNKLPDITKRSNSEEDVREKDWRNKIKGKEYADARRRATPNP